MNGLETELKNLRHKVEFVLSTIPESRNSDVVLTMEIWKEYYKDELIYHPQTNKPYVKLDKVIDLPREDFISRIRRKIQNEERLYLPTDLNVFIERARLSKEWKSYLGYQDYWQDTDWNKTLSDFFTKREQAPLPF